ncbi:MAG: serine hydrolase [Anaerolineae bacterium]|nr:serine hydrolase [Anaerolineae bacterium]
MHPIDDIRPFIEQTLTRWGVPGAAIGVIQNGEIILCEGYGLRDVGNNQPVTKDTLFPIASCTKAFAAMTAGLLVDEGILEWDKPIKAYLPDFQMHDSWATERITVRDMLCHRGGLARHDLMWYGAHYTRQEIYKRLRHLPPKHDFRSAYEYNNIMFIVAGYLVEKLTGICWETFLQTRILDPLGMNTTNCSTTLTRMTADFALPYLKKDDVVQQIPFYESSPEDDSLGLAGAMQSNIPDLLKWIHLHLNNGQLNGKPFISEASLKQMHTPHIAKPMTEFEHYLDIDMAGYGLGWGIDVRRGEKIIRHYGGIDGFSSIVALVPKHNIGIAVLVNLDGATAEDVIAFSILDKLLGKEPIDYSQRWDNIIAERKATSRAETIPQQPDTHPSRPLEDYTGDYEHPGYGLVNIRLESDGLVAMLNGRFPFKVTHFHYDIFDAQHGLFDIQGKMNFMTNWHGHINAVNWQLEPTAGDLILKRVK